MRRERSIDSAWFEDLYREHGDPWDFETSAYERDKYAETIANLPDGRFASALEVGCANGVLSGQLAPRCDRLLGVDVSTTALDAARRRCADLANVRFEERRMPGDAPTGPFDLVLLSEVIYYWDSGDLAILARYLRDVVGAGGSMMLVHWTGETDYPKSGDEAVVELRDLLGGAVAVVAEKRRDRYRLDLWRRC